MATEKPRRRRSLQPDFLVKPQQHIRTESPTVTMTGKRPRALTRTTSVSQLSSGNLSQQEFSPLLDKNPKEKLKPTINNNINKDNNISMCSSPRVVIGFDPKPCLEVASAPCSPNKASSPRSVLNSLFSRQRAKPTTAEGVGLGIVLHAVEDTKTRPADHIVIPVREDTVSVPVVVQTRRHSHPIPTPAISPCHSSHGVADHPHPEIKKERGSGARPILGWLEHDVIKVDRRDTFLLAPSPARSLMGENVAAALTASTHFLDECSFCKRHLPKDKDIFMYRYARTSFLGISSSMSKMMLVGWRFY